MYEHAIGAERGGNVGDHAAGLPSGEQQTAAAPSKALVEIGDGLEQELQAVRILLCRVPAERGWVQHEERDELPVPGRVQ